MAKNSSNWGSIASLVLAAACWGFGAVMSKYALAHIPPLTLLVVQLGVSVALLWVAIIVQGVRVPLNRDTAQLGLIGILNPGLPVQPHWPQPYHRQHVGIAVGR